MAEIKRLNYFTSQFLVEQDFKDEQAYHVAMRRRHNQVLHSWGIAHDLVVTRSADKVVSVSPGTAIDKDGREIVLLDATPVTLSTPGPGDVYVTIAYHEISEEADLYQSGVIHNYTRTTEAPGLEIVTTPPPGDGSVVVLAKIHLDGSGNVDTLDPSVRRNAGSAVPAETDLTVNSLVTNTATAHGDVDIGGAAHLSGPLGVGGDITVSGTVNGRQVATDGTNLDAHLAIVNGNPHGTTAAQVGALRSVDGVTNPGGNVDLIAANAITIAPNDANNTITIGESHSSLTGNPHATTAAQVGALPLAGGTVSGNLIVSGAGNLGIGTAVPGFRFHQLGGDHVVEDANISLRRAGMHRWTMQAQAGTGLRIVQAYSDSELAQCVPAADRRRRQRRHRHHARDRDRRAWCGAGRARAGPCEHPRDHRPVGRRVPGQRDRDGEQHRRRDEVAADRRGHGPGRPAGGAPRRPHLHFRQSRDRDRAAGPQSYRRQRPGRELPER